MGMLVAPNGKTARELAEQAKANIDLYLDSGEYQSKCGYLFCFAISCLQEALKHHEKEFSHEERT